MKEQGPDVSKMLEKLKMKEVEEENEDMSFWEELDILNEEDFLSQEEKESISAAEKDLMEKFRSNEEDCQKVKKGGRNSIENDKETDMFLNEEYAKMMPSQEEKGGILVAQPCTWTDKLTKQPGTDADKVDYTA